MQNETLASEIISDLQKKIKSFETKDRDRDETVTELSFVLEKLEHIAQNMIERYELDITKENTEANAHYFFEDRRHMFLDVRMLCDYIWSAQELARDIEG